MFWISFAELVKADNAVWQNLGTGDWYTPSNWGEVTPTQNTYVYINNGGTAQISTSGAQAFNLDIGYSGGVGTLDIQNGGSLTTGYCVIEGLSYGTGSVVVDGSGSELTSQYSFLDAGTVTVQNGGAISLNGTDNSAGIDEGSLTIKGAGSSVSLLPDTPVTSESSIILVEQGASFTTSGISDSQANNGPSQLTVTGSGSTWTNNGGFTSAGTLKVLAGGIISDTYGNAGTATVDGAGSQWKNSTNLSTNLLTVTNGGVVTSASGTVGNTVTIDSLNSAWNDSGTMQVSSNLNIQNAGSVSDTTATIGSYNTGTVTVTGSNTTWQNSGDIQMGNYDNATLLVENGGSVSNTNGYIGYYGASGTVTIDGANSVWSNRSSLYVGWYSSNTPGKLTIQNGAVVEVDGGTAGSGNGTTSIATGNATSGTVQIGNGGTSGTLKTSGIVFGLGSGHLIFDCSDTAYTFSASITGGTSDSIVQEGTGTVTLTGNTSAFAGSVSITNGTLLVHGTFGTSYSSITASTGTLGGSGTIAGYLVTLGSGGTIAPGGDGGNSHLVTNSVVWDEGGTLQSNLGPSGSASELNLSGALTKATGTGTTYGFNLNSVPGFTGSGTYNLVTFGSTNFSAADFSATGSIVGTFKISGNTLQFTATGQIPTFTSSNPSTVPGNTGSAYNFAFTASGFPTPTFKLSSGVLPPGLTLSSNGILSGTPTSEGSYSGTVTASNGVGNPVTQSFTITITSVTVGSTDTPTMPPWGLMVLAAFLVLTASKTLHKSLRV